MVFRMIAHKSGEFGEWFRVGSKTATQIANHPLDGGLTCQPGNSLESTNSLMTITKACPRWTKEFSPFCNKGVMECGPPSTKGDSRNLTTPEIKAVKKCWVVETFLQWCNCSYIAHTPVGNLLPIPQPKPCCCKKMLNSLAYQPRLGLNHFFGLSSVPYMGWIDICLPKKRSQNKKVSLPTKIEYCESQKNVAILLAWVVTHAIYNHKQTVL